MPVWWLRRRWKSILLTRELTQPSLGWSVLMQRSFIKVWKSSSMNERDFYCQLSEQLINNQFESQNLHARPKRLKDAEVLPQEQDANHSTVTILFPLISSSLVSHQPRDTRPIIPNICSRTTARVVILWQQTSVASANKNLDHWQGSKFGSAIIKPTKVCMSKHIMVHHPGMGAHPGSAKRAINYRQVI